MNSIQQHLKEFAQGTIPFSSLRSVIEKLVADDISMSSNVMSLLSEARDQGILDAPQLHALLTSVIGADPIDVTSAVPSMAEADKSVTFSVKSDGNELAVIGAGSIIKDRFVLEGLLGTGGMGAVYKARDRIKVEAKDRNPHIAIKVLSEDFKAHPESFISLQRECSKAQRLAHPNIATVYDFDRTGGMAFMTMEMLDGQPLNEYFATDLPDNGLSVEQARPIIEGLSAALAHAHKKRIVHSDFKPGNAFICADGNVKVLDFGIARAIHTPGSADTTLFDPGSLGALTPTYASPEMLDGDPPDPRDDIYALAVVSYIILTSTHPFDRNPANLARAKNMVMSAVPDLTRAQNQALRQAMAFDRESRTPNVETFLAGILGTNEVDERLATQSRLLKLLATGFVAMAACALYLLLR